ncbi:outer membrane protein assembly factor BamE [Pseudodonghicola flavimaris]|uniref:Outer membrane protein assembly factor BamE n=1 Tax=Pseudodonghicola flavimaris TaxID=3050036 RepID=A0ABT7EVI7_9RHOB|nr:outer membrane protein assembly factor BamE [Pseudodonghicola flavimaris]MDK3016354.1 outer membrane protein assembly factor BamE [Pseudodonghicola flavimaris]
MTAFFPQLKTGLRATLVGAAMLGMAGCVAIYRNHGYVPPQDELDSIRLGADSRDAVLEKLGPPTSTGVLKDSALYYVESRMRHYGATAPKVVSREVVAVSFDARGTVSGIERYGLEDGKVVPLQRRVTSSSVEDKTFLRQLLGNLGRFNPGNMLEE